MKDYTGIKANNLTAIKFIKRENTKTYWLFRCDCGNNKTLRPDHVFEKKATVKSCGCLRKSKKKSSIEVTKKLLFRNYVKSAKSRGYSFTLKYDYFLSLVIRDCFYCGTEPSREQKHATKDGYSFLCNGIDRKNNSIGYNIENCVPCCSICNVAKSNLSYDVFIDWIKRLKNN